MAKAKKLPSGSWRVRVFTGRDPVTGKQQYVSFTGPTKTEVEKKAARFADEQKDSKRITNLLVKDAISRYITAKAAVLSPSTVRGYKGMQKLYYDEIGQKKVFSLTTEDMQLWISELTMKVSPKTVANAYGLLSSSVALFRPDAVFRVTLPTKQKKRPVSPSDEQIIQLYEAAGLELKKCIALAAFGSMRRGEVCALKHKDINGVIAHVHADMIKTPENGWVYKEIPKTAESNRLVRLPAEVIELIGDGVDDDFVVKCKPDVVTLSFIRLRNKMGLPGIRFHDMRHYFASIGPVLGIPDTYLSAFGGWRPDSPVMKQTYQGTMSNMSDTYAATMTEHFSSMLNGQGEV